MKTLINTLQRSLGRSEPEPEVVSHYEFSVLFVCMGNICRSPTAEGVFRKCLAEQRPAARVHIDSAGTHAYHIGEPPDPRSQRAALIRGIDLSGLRARRVIVEDFNRFDLVVPMDRLNEATLRELCPVEHADRIRLLLDFAPQLERKDVPDPYYGGSNGFEAVLDMVEEAADGLLKHVSRELDSPRGS
jgi:protein-tyrosine phosphatase